MEIKLSTKNDNANICVVVLEKETSEVIQTKRFYAKKQKNFTAEENMGAISEYIDLMIKGVYEYSSKELEQTLISMNNWLSYVSLN